MYNCYIGLPSGRPVTDRWMNGGMAGYSKDTGIDSGKDENE